MKKTIIALIIGIVSVVLYFPIKSYAYFESEELVPEKTCEILNEQPELSAIVSFDISQDGHLAVAFKSGYVNVYDKNFVFERCIDSGSQDIYVLFVENCLMIYRWKINQYVKFDENFLNQETYDIALTSHNRNQIHKLETKNKMYYNGASYEMQAATSGAYMYLVKIQSNEKNILIDAADAVQKNVSGLLIVILLIMLFGVFALIQNIEKFKIDDEKKCSKYCFGQVEIVYSPSAVGGFCLTF